MAVYRRAAAGYFAAAMLVGIVVLPAAPALAGTIYEWTLNGQKYASDRPPPPGAKLIRVQQDRAQAARPTPPRPAQNTNGAAPAGATPADAATARQVQQDLAKVQTDRCTETRERYNTYLQAQRLFKPGPNNERQYLTDAELSAARVNAKREMDAACKAP